MTIHKCVNCRFFIKDDIIKVLMLDGRVIEHNKCAKNDYYVQFDYKSSTCFRR